jgi:hypothetical protein
MSRKLDTATASKIAATASVTISSTKVNPPALHRGWLRQYDVEMFKRSPHSQLLLFRISKTKFSC